MADSPEVERIRRDVAQEYHRVMLDLVMSGTADLRIIKDGVPMIRRFSYDDQKIIQWVDIVEVADDEA